MWRQVVAQSPDENAPAREIIRYDVGWKALNTMLKSGRSLSGHERNCCFLNTRNGRFADVSAAADIDFDDDGRILALVDWDFDGDQDFWIANRTGPQVRFLRNDAQNQHHFVAFKLTGTTCNRDAIGARVELHLADDTEAPRRIRTLRAGEGYLAQSTRWLHFGLGNQHQITRVVVRWPDGKSESFDGIESNRHYEITQGTGSAKVWTPPKRKLNLKPSKPKSPPLTDKSRIVLIAPIPIPAMKYADFNQQQHSIVAGSKGKARLVNLWASWCQPCIKELNEWKEHRQLFAKSNLDVLAVNVDEPGEDRAEQIQQIAELLKTLDLPFATGLGTKDLVVQFDIVQRALLNRQRSLPVPSSFLLDRSGNLRVIYKGPVSAQQLLADAKLLDATPEEIVAASVPYAGKWLGQPAGSSPNQIAVKLIEGGFLKETEEFILQLSNSEHRNPNYNPAEAQVFLGAIYLDQKRFEESARAFRNALKIDPNHRQSHIELAGVLVQLRDFKNAAFHFEHALERRGNDPELRLKLGMARLHNGEIDKAIQQFEQAIQLRPTAFSYHQLGTAYLRLSEIGVAIQQFDTALKLDPTFTASANNLAWLLSTTGDDTLRDGERAVQLAEGVCQSAPTVGNFDTLAAAYAEVGRFEDAVRTAQESVRLAKAAGDLKTSQRVQKRMRLYRDGKPYRDG